MEIPKDIKDNLWEYCRLNDITNINEFTIKMLKQGFNVEKYGNTPHKPKTKIVEKIVEVEKVVEKEVYITDNKEVKDLTDKITKLESEIVSLKAELNKEKTKKRTDIYGDPI